jgi:hypothetical protein
VSTCALAPAPPKVTSLPSMPFSVMPAGALYWTSNQISPVSVPVTVYVCRGGTTAIPAFRNVTLPST